MKYDEKSTGFNILLNVNILTRSLVMRQISIQVRQLYVLPTIPKTT
jgi:hypothetical protein